jgi:YD repeat-containing protein
MKTGLFRALLCVSAVSSAQVCVSELDNLPVYPLEEKVIYCEHDLTTPLGSRRYYYDKKRRLASEHWHNYTSDTAIRIVREFRYDDDGLVAELRHHRLHNLDTVSGHTVKFTYNSAGKLLMEKYFGEYEKTLVWQYNADGSIQKRTESSPAWSSVLRYEYDSLGQVKRKVWDQGSFVTCHYERGRLVREVIYDRAVVTRWLYRYDETGLLVKEERHYYDPLDCFSPCSDYVYLRFYSDQ